ncbi:ribosome-associated heat shock protein Hsp15 [Saccharobesus litoralis]|uniref:Heat shock protein 15 n=1 Tax=Saccharobesus litoralis TaxID=2172099 RepID=A0A2S0VWY5_9ALTE|nr:ribosome-associated heat shock protein Hsp15 [Saccharobesus litoralis]AWB68693.1 ribosome-associated heat shock protein Hsp15 [Saccharobesus litoralis]
MTTKRQSEQESSVRIDKWLWAARFYKTRGLARDMIQGGKVRYNGQRTKPSKIVELGAEITIAQGFDEKTVVIEKISEQRRGAPEAQLLYKETTASQEKRQQRALERKMAINVNPHPEAKPDKKQRRQLLNIKQQNL